MRFAIRNVGKILRSGSGCLFGRATAGDGPGEELTPAQVRSLCSVYSTSEVDAIAAVKATIASLAVGSSGSDVNWSGTTINIPDAGAAARGLVTTGSQTFAGAKTFTADITMRSPSVQGYITAVSPNGTYNVRLSADNSGDGLIDTSSGRLYLAPAQGMTRLYNGVTSMTLETWNATLSSKTTLSHNALSNSSGNLTITGFSELRLFASSHVTLAPGASGYVYCYSAGGTQLIVQDAAGTRDISSFHNGTDGVIDTSHGKLKLSPATTVQVTAAATFDSSVTVNGAFNFPPITKAALLVTTPTAATAGTWRITDSTPANRTAYPDGTNWRYSSDDTIVV